MTGIVIATHCQLGDALIEAAEFIIGSKPEAITSVSIDLKESAEKLRKKIQAGMKAVDQKQGILIMTDMFGGTPSNLSYSFLEEDRVEVISGVNLPMLLKALGTRDKVALSDLAVQLEAYGKKSITLASSILRGNKRT
ncbi:MAG: PTS fructose transporter subunit IIA [Desulfobacterales bacterium]|nr:PTS fructose transporter subunit IIA [Desulfobacterales bacterium]